MGENSNTPAPAKIRFVGCKCVDFQFKASDEYVAGNSIDEFSLNFEHGGYRPEGESNRFMISFKLSLSDDAGTTLSCHFMGVFVSSEKIDDKFIGSPFVKINAPAIMFPYIRSYVSTVTINAGLDPLTLPTINFTAGQNKS